MRELKNLVEGLAIAGIPGGRVEPAHLRRWLPPVTVSTATPMPDGGAPEAATIRDEMRAIERRRIVEALEGCSGNQSQAARALGMPRRTFVARLKQYAIRRVTRVEGW